MTGTGLADLLHQLEVTPLLLQADTKEEDALRAVANIIRRKRDELLVRPRANDPLLTAMQLLDLVPCAKDLDAIGFDCERHAVVAGALALVSLEAAEFAEGYLGDGGV